MKKFLLFMMFPLLLTACQKENKATQVIKDEARYEMFPTENIWTFLKLDTSNGRIWQVQYSINNDYRGEAVLNDKALAEGNLAQNGRFTLYPTKNMYNFILLDKKDGRTWQVQWSIEENSRMIIPIQQ